MPTTPTPSFSITRVFNAPRSAVWKAWTDKEALIQWWGPKHAKLKIDRLDLRPGGDLLYAVTDERSTVYGKFVYQELLEPERIVFVNSFADASWKVALHPENANWPLEILNYLQLSEQAGGKTLLSMTSLPFNCTDPEIATFAEGSEAMTKGFNGTFDQLEKYLALVTA